MIRVVMQGRLGNNLFQYALGRRLAREHDVPLVIDGSWFNRVTWPFVSQLSRLPGFTDGEARIARPFSLGSRVLRKINGRHHWEYLGLPVIREAEGDHGFDCSLLSSPPDCVLFGYFQTPLYFDAIEDIIREELRTDELGLEHGHEELACELRKPGSVAVHVRRTDYVNNPNLFLLGLFYYQKAMDRLRGACADIHFHVFSDDSAWCEEHLTGGDITVHTHSNPYSPLEDIHLMSLASHHVIANSSYSWWAAWLGKKLGQRVMLPDTWFRTGIRAPIAEKQCPGWEIIPSS